MFKEVREIKEVNEIDEMKKTMTETEAIIFINAAYDSVDKLEGRQSLLFP